RSLHLFPTRRSSDLSATSIELTNLSFVIWRRGLTYTPNVFSDLATTVSVGKLFMIPPSENKESSISTGAKIKGKAQDAIKGFKIDRKSTRLNSSHVK